MFIFYAPHWHLLQDALPTSTFKSYYCTINQFLLLCRNASHSGYQNFVFTLLLSYKLTTKCCHELCQSSLQLLNALQILAISRPWLELVWLHLLRLVKCLRSHVHLMNILFVGTFFIVYLRLYVSSVSSLQLHYSWSTFLASWT